MHILSLIVMFCWCGSLLSNIEVKKGKKKNNTVEPVLVLLLVPTTKGDHYRQVELRFHCSNNNNINNNNNNNN